MNTRKLPTKRQQEVLLRALKHIQQEPDRLDMHHWGQFHPTGNEDENDKVPITFQANSQSKEQPIPPCKTTSCLAGTVLLVTKQGKKEVKKVLVEEPKNRYYTVDFPDGTDDIAQEILKLTEKQAGDLFYFWSWGREVQVPTGKIDHWGDPETKYVRVGWPKVFERMYKKAKNGKERFKALKARVLHFNKTGE